METQAYFEHIRDHIHARLSAAETEIDLAVAWFTDRGLLDVLCQKAKKGVTIRVLLFDDDINNYLSFKDLQQAFDDKNLDRVTALLDYLKHGKPYTAEHTALTEKRHLRTVIDRLRHRRAQLLDALQALRTHDTWQTIQNIEDWNTYFDNQKVALQTRLDKLEDEWRRINK